MNSLDGLCFALATHMAYFYLVLNMANPTVTVEPYYTMGAGFGNCSSCAIVNSTMVRAVANHTLREPVIYNLSLDSLYLIRICTLSKKTLLNQKLEIPVYGVVAVVAIIGLGFAISATIDMVIAAVMIYLLHRNIAGITNTGLLTRLNMRKKLREDINQTLIPEFSLSLMKFKAGPDSSDYNGVSNQLVALNYGDRFFFPTSEIGDRIPQNSVYVLRIDTHLEFAMLSNPSALPNLITFPEAKQLVGLSNWAVFWDHVKSIARSAGLNGYLDGTITAPISVATAPNVVPVVTPVNSRNPTPEEWELRDARLAGIVFQNIKDPRSIGVTQDMTSNVMWIALTGEYENSSTAAQTLATERIQQCKYTAGTAFEDYFKSLEAL
ncbi:hypothetical protein D9757_013865 [Collybiopsis confluens]|uniref:Uncharacterized protein n=1 Tax=Collybiopsis confluens TaxID=2823264 RepID=A0A8H5D6T1_9AGAR|nr:hypothetical protein D9757_013865 [Collybiopsis confluens]